MLIKSFSNVVSVGICEIVLQSLSQKEIQKLNEKKLDAFLFINIVSSFGFEVLVSAMGVVHQGGLIASGAPSDRNAPLWLGRE